MGNESVTVKNLRVLQVDEPNGIVVVQGMGCIVRLHWLVLTTCV